jgi:trk system potassium uptake protein TrkH
MEETKKPPASTDLTGETAEKPPQSHPSGIRLSPLHEEFHKLEQRLESGIRKYSPAEITIFGFTIAIALGSVILYIIENAHGEALSYVDALFTSASAICVTGLTTVDFSRFSFPGQFAVMVLIQIGGFGVITAFRLLWLGRGEDLSMGSAQTLGSVLDCDGRQQTVLQILASTAKITIAAELVGCTVLYVLVQDSIHDMSPFWFSVFHTISAFNNAGFGLYPDSLTQFQNDVWVNFTFAGMIILGGIGYPVLLGLERILLLGLHRALGFSEALMEMVAIRKPEKLSLVEPFYNFVDRLYLRSKRLNEELKGVATPLQMKVVIYGTILLIALGMVFVLAAEWSNPATLEKMPWDMKLLAAFFQSVTARTAGFNTIDTSLLETRTVLLLISLMFIGAAPQGAAGGIKIPTFATMLGYIRTSFRARTRVTIFNYVVSKISVGNAVKLYVMSSTFVLLSILVISAIEVRFTLTQLAFEVVSAFGTVGLSMGITSSLSVTSKILLIVVMFTGRVGLLTIGSAILKPADGETRVVVDDGMKLQIG